MPQLLFSVSLVVMGIAAGYGLRAGIQYYQLSLSIDALRKNLQKLALLFFNPIAILGATWTANIQDIKIAALPFMGMTALFTGGCIAFFASRVMGLSARQTGSYIVCGGFTNIGSLGALFCFIFLGEAGFALVPFYKLFEELIYYAVGFPVAKSYSDDLTRNRSLFMRMKSAVLDLFVLMAVSSIITGLILNVAGVERPGWYAGVNAIFIPLAAFLLLVSIGMAMRFTSVKTFFKPGLVIAVIKFLIVPFIVVAMGYGLGLEQIDDGLPLKVVLILSAMPVGFIAMVPPTIYKLDIEMANACWLLTNAALLIVIPLLLFIIQYI